MGLARTQLEHMKMPPHSEWSWLEGYGLLEADAAVVHGETWAGAVQQVQARIDALMPEERLNAEYARAQAWVQQAPTEIMQRGSGWGALERLRREQGGETGFFPLALVFDDQSLGDLQAPWLGLLREGQMPDAFSVGYMVQAEWRTLLEELARSGQAGWLACYHLGVMRYQDGEVTGAAQAWEQSNALKGNAWALRGLALLQGDAGMWELAAALYRQAHEMLPNDRTLALEMGKALLMSGQAERWLQLARGFPIAYSQNGRICLLTCQAALLLNDFERVQGILEEGIQIVDYREGEDALTQLWLDFHMKRISAAEGLPMDAALRRRVEQEFPLPTALDYRMGV